MFGIYNKPLNVKVWKEKLSIMTYFDWVWRWFLVGRFVSENTRDRIQAIAETKRVPLMDLNFILRIAPPGLEDAVSITDIFLIH